MPAALPADWHAIERAFKQGVRPCDIERDTGVAASTIRQRAKRDRWRVSTAQAARTTQSAIREIVRQQVAVAKPAVESAIATWIDKTLGNAKKGMSHVSQHLDSQLDLDNLSKAVNILDKVDLVGRRALGLDKDEVDQLSGVSLTFNGSTQVVLSDKLAVSQGVASGVTPSVPDTEPDTVIDVEPADGQRADKG